MDRLIRIPEVMAIVGLRRTAILERRAAGTFPPSVDLGGGRVAWRESDIEAWMKDLPNSNNPPMHVRDYAQEARERAEASADAVSAANC